MKSGRNKWYYLTLLSLVWGSSFILIKRALLGLSPIQLGGLRITFAASFLLIIGFNSLKEIQSKDWKWIFLAGFLSSFFPPFLFALAQTEIDSSIASIFNALTPLNTTIVGALFFGILITKKQILGVMVGLLGTIVLIIAGAKFSVNQDYRYAVFIVLSSLGYAGNINIIKKYLSHLSPLTVTTASFGVVIIPALVLVWDSGFFTVVGENAEMQVAVVYVIVLAILGTALANMYFNKLIKVASPVFAASVTYTAPLVAVVWGVWDDENLGVYQLLGGMVVLIGVYLVNRTTTARKT